MAANLPAYQPLIKQSIDTVANNRQHALYKYFGGAAWDNYDQLFFCSCQTQPHEAESERRPVTGIVGAFFNDRCPTLAEKYEIYGKFGTGTFGFIFAARDRRPSSLGQICHYAIKVQYYNTHQNGTADILRHHSMSRYTHKEAFALHFLRSCDRISQIHEAGVHGQYAVIVMDQFGVRPDREMNTFPEVTHRNAQVLDMCAYTGAHFIFEDKALFIEVQVCKVVSDVLEALLFMNDRKIVHEDMGLKNILVDSDLRAQLLDFDQCRLAINNRHFRKGTANFVYAQEDQMSPELLIAINSHPPEGDPREGEQKDVLVDYDIRDEQLWKFACMIFKLLHGYAPFTDLEQLARNHRAVIRTNYGKSSESDERIDRAKRRDRRYRRQRRERILNAPLQIAEELEIRIPPTREEPKKKRYYQQQLTQDAIDVLQAMFLKDRVERPSVEELAAFPWFQGSYMDLDIRFSYPLGVPGKAWTGPWPTDLDRRPSDSI